MQVVIHQFIDLTVKIHILDGWRIEDMEVVQGSDDKKNMQDSAKKSSCKNGWNSSFCKVELRTKALYDSEILFSS